MTTPDTITAPAPILVPEFTFAARIKPAVDFGTGAFGNRMFFEVTGGRAEGERFNADMLSGGGDWLLMGADGLGRLDVRATFRTDDGAHVYVQYHGLIELTDAVMTALSAGGDTDFGDQYFRTAPRFETGDERYAWLQRSVFLGHGHISNGGAAYTVYRVD